MLRNLIFIAVFALFVVSATADKKEAKDTKDLDQSASHGWGWPSHGWGWPSHGWGWGGHSYAHRVQHHGWGGWAPVVHHHAHHGWGWH